MTGASLVEHALLSVALNMSIGTWLMHPNAPLHCRGACILVPPASPAAAKS